MPVPEEVAYLESSIKRFQQRLVTLKTKSRDIVTQRNTLEVAVGEKTSELKEMQGYLVAILSGEVISLEEYTEAKAAVYASEDEIQMAKNKILNLAAELEKVHEEIPAVEEAIGHAKTELGAWGVVLTFTLRP